MRHAALALSGGLGVAVAFFACPAVVDMPVHVVRFRLMADLLDGAARNPFYMLDLRWLPNTLIDTVFALLATVFSPEVLSRLAVLLPILAVVGTVVGCRRMLYPDEPYPILHLVLALPLLLLGDTYIMGLHSFMVSLCCAVTGYVALFRGVGTRLSYLARQALAVLLAGVVCWLHLGGLLGLVLPALGDGVVALARAWHGDSARTRRMTACALALVRRHVGLIVPVLAAMAAMPAYIAGMEIQNESAPPGPFYIGAYIVSRIETILSPASVLFELRVLNAWWALSAVCLLLVAFALARLAWSCRRGRRPVLDAGLLSAMAIALLLTLILPNVAANTAYVNWRPAFALMLLATLATSLRNLPRGTIRLAGGCAGLALAVKAMTFMVLSADTTRAITEFRRAGDAIEPRSTVFLTRAIEGEDRPSWRRSAHVWQLRQHIAAFAALDREALVPNLFIGRGTQNLILREPYRDFAVPSATLFLPNLLALQPTRPLGPDISQTERVAHWRARIDYLVIAGWRVDRLSLPELGGPLFLSEDLRIHHLTRSPAGGR